MAFADRLSGIKYSTRWYEYFTLFMLQVIFTWVLEKRLDELSFFCKYRL